jgi:H+-transporting ATPase
MFLQIANAAVGFTEENNAGNAIAALKSALKPRCYACRNGEWLGRDAVELVPGDLIKLKLGDVIPADAILVHTYPLEVDQAALTGESLPVTVHQWGHLKMGSAVKRGEGDAIVVATGSNTFLGTAAALMNSVQTTGHLQAVLLRVTMVLLGVSVVLCAVIFAKLMTASEDSRHIVEGGGHGKVMASLSVVIVILVASIPIAIEVVCTSTLAVGSHQMASKKVIVARLSAIEELAGMNILCSDKTGTLTLNELSLREPVILAENMDSDEVTFFGSLASRREKGNQDAIDLCICNSVSAERQKLWAQYKETHFEPFNPTDKRATADLVAPDGSLISVAKGAPHVILKMSHNKEKIHDRVMASVQELADRGFRSLGVAVLRAPPKSADAAGAAAAAETSSADAKKDERRWEYLGVLSLFDPPRHDTKSTIAAAIANGIEVKMVTGDHTAIAKETCRELGMGTNILNTSALDAIQGDGSGSDPAMIAVVDRVIMEASGFAEVMPEHKFLIVERIRQQGYVTGMTGDGVNDAPALKRADVGIAVHGATDAARAAADLVLTEPGLSVIIDAILESRKIFQRMRNYLIYRIACTIQLLCFFFFAVLCIEPDAEFAYGKATDFNFAGDMAHATAFTLPVISLVIITILNDGCMITISHDRVIAENVPQVWALKEATIVASVLGFVACLSSLILLALCMAANSSRPGLPLGVMLGSDGRNYITWFELRTIIYLKISISDFLTLFSARTRTWFWERRLGRALAIAAFVATAASTLLSLFWDGIFAELPGAYMAGLRHSKGAVVITWIYCILWWFLQDICKVLTYHVLDTYFTSPEDRDKRTLALRKAEAAGTIDENIAAASPKAAASLTVGHNHGAAAAGTGAGSSPAGSIGRGQKQFLPSGVDLNAIVSQAHEETLRSRKAREAREAEARKEQRSRLAEIASGGARAAATAAAAAAADPADVKVAH